MLGSGDTVGDDEISHADRPEVQSVDGVQTDLSTQIQGMTAMMGKLVNSLTPTPYPDGRPQQGADSQPRQLFEPGGNGQNSAASGAGRYSLKTAWTQGACFNCGQVGHIAKGCPQRSANHLNYQGPGQ